MVFDQLKMKQKSLEVMGQCGSSLVGQTNVPVITTDQRPKRNRPRPQS